MLGKGKRMQTEGKKSDFCSDPIARVYTDSCRVTAIFEESLARILCICDKEAKLKLDRSFCGTIRISCRAIM